MNNNKIGIEQFDGCTLGLLGDIHKYQYMNPEKTVAYPGSLIQQNHAETLKGHGLLYWDIKNKTSEFIEVKNDWGYVTLVIDGGELPDTKQLPKKPRIRIKYTDTDHSELKEILTEIKKKYEVQDVVLYRQDTLSSVKSGDRDMSYNMGNIRDVSYQNKLIKDYLDRHYGVEESLMKRIYEINNDLNKKLPTADIRRNIIWTPKKFEFSNMFSYGEDNYIDFQTMKGSYGIFAPNASGKSSLLDSLTFCCFDKCDRTSKPSNILNNKREKLWCKFNFEIAGTDYFIERSGHESRRGNFRVDVDFWYIDENGETISLNGEQRKDTNAIIKSYLGEYDDFILTTLSLQNNNTSFIDKSQKERKELLSQFLDINIFDRLYELALTNSRDIQAIIKEYSSNDHSDEIDSLEQDLKAKNLNLILNDENKNGKLKEISEYENKIYKLNKLIILIDDQVDDIDPLIEEKESLLEKIKGAEGIQSSMKEELKILIDNHKTLKSKLDSIDEVVTEEKYNELIDLKDQFEKKESELKILKISISHKLEKLDHLSEHEYDPNCSYCMNNVFVKDAIQTKSELENDKIRVDSLKTEKDILHKQIFSLKEYEYTKLNLDSYKSEVLSSENELYRMKSSILEINLKYEKYKSKVTEIDQKILRYKDQEEIIKKNREIQDSIDYLEGELYEVQEALSVIQEDIISCNREISAIKTKKQSIEDNIQRLKSLENQYKSYEYYIDCIKRDGIPYELITKAIPKIESEINNILTGLVDFNIVLDSDGKNINAYIAYSDSDVWPLELSSGMEKFISSLAIRTALISISSLPRPNFIVIDEGFGTLDEDNINSIFMFFNYLKSRFEFFITISHIDTMRDLMDNLIEIKKEKGFSKITSG